MTIITDPLDPNVFSHSDDLVPGFSQYLPSAMTLTGNGTETFLAADHADYDGLGVLHFGISTGAGSAAYRPQAIYHGGMSPRIEARVKLPSPTPGDVELFFGFYNGIDHAAVMAYDEGDTDWKTSCASGATTDSDVATSETIVAGWQLLRVEIDDDTEARFYVDNVLISTLSGAGAVPTVDEELAVFISVAQATGGAIGVAVDWIRVWGSNLGR